MQLMMHYFLKKIHLFHSCFQWKGKKSYFYFFIIETQGKLLSNESDKTENRYFQGEFKNFT